MGLLSCGQPLTWDETKKMARHVQQHGIQQFIHMFERHRDRHGDPFLWGDEIEYILVRMDDDRRTARVSLCAEELLEVLNEKEQNDPEGVRSLWRPEHAAFMIESTPARPFDGILTSVQMVEASMRLRRQEVSELLRPNEHAFSITNFARMGTPGYTWPEYLPNPSGCTRSAYVPDEAIFGGHPRYRTIARNIPTRRGEKVDINLTVFKDENTMIPVEGSPADRPDSVHMDALSFGCGCCCLQVTIQANDLTEARTLYDQLTPLCPILLALTAAAPAFRGYLTETDCRWQAISESCDCRTAEERGEIPLDRDRFLIRKSRYDATDLYLSPGGEQYNDIPVEYDDSDYQQLRDAGVDHTLALHVAHLFIRDPISLFKEKIHQNDMEEMDHFENIQSTNWQSMRFKPPPPKSNIGWRVEFRPCEVQLTDFENAAFAVFIVLMTRVIIAFNLNFLVPISKVGENMQRAQEGDACRRQRFWFRKDVTGSTKEPRSEPEFELMSVNQIINGSSDFPGLAPLINNYLTTMNVDADTYITIQQYLRLIGGRASGKLQTTAAWMRNEIVTHPEYKRDSVVSDRINYDLLKKIQSIQSNELYPVALLGSKLNDRVAGCESIEIAGHDYVSANKLHTNFNMGSVGSRQQQPL